MDRKTARELDRWLTDDRNDFGPADAPTDAPSTECPARPPHRPLCNATLDAALRGVARCTPDAAAITAAHRNALETRRAALAARLMAIDAHAWLDFADAASQFDLHRSRRTAERLAELLIDLEDRIV